MIKITNNTTNFLYFNLNASTVSEVYELKLLNNNTQNITNVTLNDISDYTEYQKFTLDMGITASNADYVDNLDGGYYDFELYQVFTNDFIFAPIDITNLGYPGIQLDMTNYVDELSVGQVVNVLSDSVLYTMTITNINGNNVDFDTGDLDTYLAVFQNTSSTIQLPGEKDKLEVGIAHIIQPLPTRYDYDYASASTTKIIYKS